MRAAFIFGGFIVSFGGGAYFGAEAYRHFAIRRMKKLAPMIQNAIVSIVEKSLREDVTHEEMVRHIQEEIDFMKIVDRSI